MILSLVDEAVASGARLSKVCERLGVSDRALQRWRLPAHAEDKRCGPRRSPANKLTEAERRKVLEVVNSEPYRDLSPKQIVPRLADEGCFVGSESTMYRILREEGQMAHRGPTRPPVPRPAPELVATGPNQVWTWDITYLRSSVRGSFFYLYLFVDLFSRRIVGWEVYEKESAEYSTALFLRLWREAGCPAGLRSHSDNGGPMKGATLLATFQALGVVPSFSRPRVSDDNPFSEALFRTLKYRPSFPRKPFVTLEAARAWVADFVRWYNTEHRHSALRFVTPDQRHFGQESAILTHRERVYREARRRHPERWTRGLRNWSPAGEVRLGPDAEVQAAA